MAASLPSAPDGFERPEFHSLLLEELGGGQLTLADFEGKVVVLNFWASWCPPCRWEMPAFEAIYREFKDQDVVFVGIAVSDFEEDAMAFAELVDVSYPLAMDTGELARQYRVLSLPTTFLLDRHGRQTRRIDNIANEGVLKVFIRGLLQEG